MKNKSSFGKMILYDLQVGGKITFWRYVFTLGILCFICQLVIFNAETLRLSFNFWDLSYQVFEGTPDYIKSRTSEFKLPVILILFQLFLMFLIGNYPKYEMSSYGKYVFLSCGSRKKWWFSKCIWVTLHILAFYMATFIILATFTWLHHFQKIDFSILDSWIYQKGSKNIALFLSNLLLLPMLASLTLGLIQTFFVIFVKPVWGYIISSIILIISAYKTNALLIGNYMMLIRNRYFSQEGAITFNNGIIVCFIFIFLTLFIGMYCIERCDILNLDNGYMSFGKRIHKRG